ncbi:hypothetical protein PIIN_00188 [Serendipita indica DSM 11827]|uniref:Thioredoxin-like protein n=1 Tax=Serendipita indica (strain DSM 11827) TaxID=1109443 RepID=G4T577_SERID|nr:hypothetical protein PIIN_00188 [Serendipita indica DSM 11827]
MSFRPPRNLPVISIFHNASSPPSKSALSLLRKAVSEPYPPSKSPLSVELSVVERLPTSDQFRTMQRYYGRPVSSFLSAHPASGDGKGEDEVERVRDAAQKNPMALKYPIVVDWDAGKIAVGDVDEVKRLLDARAKGPSEGGQGSQGSESKGFLSSLFGSSS